MVSEQRIHSESSIADAASRAGAFRLSTLFAAVDERRERPPAAEADEVAAAEAEPDELPADEAASIVLAAAAAERDPALPLLLLPEPAPADALEPRNDDDDDGAAVRAAKAVFVRRLPPRSCWQPRFRCRFRCHFRCRFRFRFRCRYPSRCLTKRRLLAPVSDDWRPFHATRERCPPRLSGRKQTAGPTATRRTRRSPRLASPTTPLAQRKPQTASPAGRAKQQNTSASRPRRPWTT